MSEKHLKEVAGSYIGEVFLILGNALAVENVEIAVHQILFQGPLHLFPDLPSPNCLANWRTMDPLPRNRDEIWIESRRGSTFRDILTKLRVVSGPMVDLLEPVRLRLLLQGCHLPRRKFHAIFYFNMTYEVKINIRALLLL
jgi:hypothetical protein